jgi:DNA-binding MarR family transcriptional regulator
MPAPPPSRPTEADPGRFVDDYLLALLARASHVVSAEFHARLRARGVPVGVWRVLATLSGAPAAGTGPGTGEGATVGELARVCLMQQPTMTKLLDRMGRDGLVERRPTAADRRHVLVVLAPKGKALVQDLLAAARAHEAEVLARHPESEAQAIKSLLRAVIARQGPG